MRYSTGIFQLDGLLGGGLIPGSCEIYGGDAAGKTTICLSVMREADRKGFPTALIYTEGIPDTGWIEVAGPRQCAIVTPYFAEAGLDAAYSALAHGAKVVVIDSLTALEPIDEQHLQVGTRIPSAQFNLVKGGMRALRSKARELGSLVLVTNQLRTPLKDLVKRPTSALGKAIHRSCDVRIRADRAEMRTEYGEFGYLKTKLTIKKSLHRPPGGEAHAFIFPNGINRNFELLRALIDEGILVKRGAYFMDEGIRSFGPGYKEAAEKLEYYAEHYIDKLAQRRSDGS